MSDYSRLVLALDEKGGDPLYCSHEKSEETLCEICGDEGPGWSSKCFDDPDLLIRQRQTGGDTSYCETCLDNEIFATYDETPEYSGTSGRYFVRPEGPLPTPTRTYGGC